MNIAIIGTGAYGLSNALMLLKNNNKIKMWVESKEKCDFYEKNRNSLDFLPGITIPKEIEFSCDYEYVLKDADVVFIMVAAKFVASVSKEILKYQTPKMHFCIGSKGIEQGTCMFVDQVFKKFVKTKNLAVMSGPSFAIDLASSEPIGLTLASKNKQTIKKIKMAYGKNTVKLRPSNDIIGIEICGSIKNIIALAAGILNGLGYAESTRSFLITESLHDIKELIYGLGGRKKTILSYAGVGDLLLTATSKKSRNYSYGILVGKKEHKKSEEYLKNNTVEGYYTLKSIYKLLRKKKIKMPVIDLIYKVIMNNEDPELLVAFLLNKK